MWYTLHNQHILLTIIAKPNAKKTEMVRVTEEGIHVSLHAKPHHGEANKALISFLSDYFRIPKNQIVLKRGETSKRKWVMLPFTEQVKSFLEGV